MSKNFSLLQNPVKDVRVIKRAKTLVNTRDIYLHTLCIEFFSFDRFSFGMFTCNIHTLKSNVLSERHEFRKKTLEKMLSGKNVKD